MKEYKNNLSNLTNQYYLRRINNQYRLYQYIYFIDRIHCTTDEFNKSVLYLGNVVYLKPIAYNKYSFIIENVLADNELQNLVLETNNFSFQDNIHELHMAVKHFTAKDQDALDILVNQRK